MITGKHRPSTKAGRLAMASEVAAITERFGIFTYMNIKENYWRKGTDTIYITFGAIEIFFDIQKDMLPLVHWYVRGTQRLTAAVNRIADVNIHHRGKATAYPQTWDALLSHLEDAFELIAADKALEKEAAA